MRGLLVVSYLLVVVGVGCALRSATSGLAEGSDVIHLNAAERARVGIVVAHPQFARLPHEIKGVGHVLNSLETSDVMRERPAFVPLLEHLSKGEWFLARADLTAYPNVTTAQQIAVVALGSETVRTDAEILGPTENGKETLLLLKTNSLPANSPIGAFIASGDDDHEGVLVPERTILQEGPKLVAFVQIAERTFKKVTVDLDHATATGWFVTNGLSAQDRVVIEGAPGLLAMTRR